MRGGAFLEGLFGSFAAQKEKNTFFPLLFVFFTLKNPLSPQKNYQQLALLFSYIFYYLCGMYTKYMPYTLLYMYYYTDRLSIWLSVDPLADKYLHLSPYAYCADNTVKYIDPDGMKIVGTDGKPVTFSPDKGWSSNAPKDVIKVGNTIKSRFKG